MAITAIFSPKTLNVAQYDEVSKRLEQDGASNPKGRLYQVCYGNADQLQVLGVWESVEDLKQFGQILGPIMQQIGLEPGQPMISPVHRSGV